MQQPVYQDQQSGQQGAGQQMLLCPVRLVYETQILVQPGEQIQPNQTIFINQHNPPPWIQNRPQNNLMYVQQVAPNNFVPQLQQQTAQNPIYIHQNYNNLQQMIPQQIISQAQHKEVRTANVQMATTGPYNTSAPSETTQGTPTANFGVIPANYMQNQINQNQINFIPTNIHNVQTPPRPVATSANVMTYPRNIEVSQTVCRPVGQQAFQHESNLIQNSLPPSITMIPIPSTQPHQRPNENTHDHVTQMRPTQTLIGNKPNLPQPSGSAVSSTPHERIVKKIAAISPKGSITVNTIVNTTPKNVPSYSYRPIQPRPQQQRHLAPNIIPTNTHSQIQGPPKMQPPVHYNANTQTYTITSNYVNPEQSAYNRKRKSESPDEVQKKMLINYLPQKNSPVAVVSSVQTTHTVSSIGVNTMPIQRTHKIQTPNTINSRNLNIIQNEIIIQKSNHQHQQKVESQTVQETSSQSDTEKLLRNTVFTQARNRVLADKQETLNNNIILVEINVSDATSGLENDLTKITEDSKNDVVKKEEESKKDLIKKKEESKKDLIKKKEESIKDLIKKKEESIKDLIKKKEESKKDLIKKKIESKKDLVKKGKESKKSVVQREKESKKDIKSDVSNTTVVETEEEKACREANNLLKSNIREINVLGNSKSNDENGFILTHVLDGYVIQESNVAFPIRRPLKEKTLPPNTADSEVEEDSKEVKTENRSSKIFNLSELNINDAKDNKRLTDQEENKHCQDSVNKNDNPFGKLKTETVKAWTVKQLTEHLLKYNWDETVSVLLEHEIDGESLYLVSKNQLISIGISEDHADIICDFVKS